MTGSFQPKFVDLVRNYTTTVGTGDFILGPVVNGYNGLAAALSVGDTFYYSAIGIDKPAEREVGRGTLLTGGIVRREPVSGAKTNFTSGTKALALIAAAEWFEDVQHAIAAGGGGAADRAELASKPTGGSAFLREAGREGTFVFENADVSDMVGADPAQAVYVAPAGTDGSAGAWVRRDRRDLDLRWFGAVADFDGTTGTDNAPALQAAVALVAAMSETGNPANSAGPRIRIPAGRYHCATTINVYTTVHIVGDGSGQNLGRSTILHWPLNTAGLVLNSYGTTGYANSGGPATGAYGSIIEGVAFASGNGGGALDVSSKGGGAAFDRTGNFDGILIRANGVVLRDVSVSNFARNGIAIWAGSDSNPILGNANRWVLRDVSSRFNGEHGLHVKGTDANAGACFNGDFSFNGRWGVRDESFLGNAYHSCHAESNGLGNGSTEVDSVCAYSYGGVTNQRWYVIDGQETAAATTQPGSNASIWREAKTTDGPAIGGRPWVDGLEVRSGGPYFGNGTFHDCYSEGGQGASQNVARIGGMDGSGTVAAHPLKATPELRAMPLDGAWAGSRAIGVAPTRYLKGYGRTTYLGGSQESGDVLVDCPNVVTGKNPLRLTSVTENGSADYFFDAGYNLLAFLRFTWQDTTYSFGRSTTQPYKVQTNDLFLGSGNNSRWISCSNVAPTTGDHATGEFVFNRVGTSGLLGWRCTVAGTPGTWEAVYSGLGTNAIGYSAGAGGTVTQATSKSNGVTLNKLCGQVTTNAAALAAGAAVSFTVTNSQVAATDTIELNLASGNASAGTYNYQVDKVGGGSFVIWLKNVSTASLSEALVFNFSVKKAVAA